MSIIRETTMSARLEMLLTKLDSSDLLQFARQVKIQADLKKLEKILLKIHAVIDDAEEKKITHESVRIWLGELKDLADDVEDILDEFATEALRRKSLLESDQPRTSKFQKLVPACCAILSPRSFKFNSKIVYEFKEVTDRLQDIVEQKDQLNLKEYSEGTTKMARQRLPTTSLVNEAKVYGREKEKEEIVQFLLKDDSSSGDGFSVIPVIGIGGVGKTTLAQLVYNDLRMQGHFDLTEWVCVSEDFDVIRITKTILRPMTDHPVVDNDLNFLQEELKKKLLGKKFLFVLDDVWNESYNNWTVLSCPFEAGAAGSKIVVTTRNRGVAEMMGTVSAYRLKELSNDDCLRVFAQHSLGATDFSMHQSLKEIGEKIVIRCNGLPLTAKTLGGHLRGKRNPSDWKNVLNGKWQDIDMI